MSEMGTIPMETNLVAFKNFQNPITKIVNYVILLHNCDDENMLIMEIFFLVLSIICISCYAVSKLLITNLQDSFLELYASVSKNDCIKCLQLLQKYPQFVNMYHPSEGYTPFLKGCLNGNTQMVQVMLESGADINLKSFSRENAFYLAVYNHVKNPYLKDASCIHTLYYAGISINEPNDKGYAPIHLACSFGHAPLVRWLLAKRVNTNVNPDPYLLARTQGHLNVARLLRTRIQSTNTI